MPTTRRSPSTTGSAVAIGWRAGHDGGGLRGAEGVGWDLVRAVGVEERADAPHDAPGDGGDVLVAGRIELTKVQAAIGGAREDTVRDQSVEVDVTLKSELRRRFDSDYSLDEPAGRPPARFAGVCMHTKPFAKSTLNECRQ